MELPKVKYLPFACLIIETISRKMVAHLINLIQSANSAEPKKRQTISVLSNNNGNNS